MLKRIGLSFLLVATIILVKFPAGSYANSVFVLDNYESHGNADSLLILANTKFMERKPVIVFSKQPENRQVSLLKTVNNIVFYDSAWQDLAVEFSTPTVIYSPAKIVRVDKEAVFELWLDASGFNIGEGGSLTSKLTFDKKPINFKLERLGRKYINIGELKLRAGNHSLETDDSFPLSNQLKLLLINKKEREGLESIIWRKINNFSTQLHYIFTKEEAEFFVNPQTRDNLYDVKIKLKRISPNPKAVQREEIYDPLIKIDDRIFSLQDFVSLGNDKYMVSKIKIDGGYHKYATLKNNDFNVEWAILESDIPLEGRVGQEAPEIIFKRVNPAKYLVSVKKAEGPFWLVFSERFDPQWKLFQLDCAGHIASGDSGCCSEGPGEIIHEYPELRIKEARHEVKFILKDINFLFRKPLKARQIVVNGYANGWYIEPERLGLKDNFILVIYFLPQSISYLGLIISILVWVACLTYLLNNLIKNKILRKQKY